MYQFLNTPPQIALLISRCNLALALGTQGLQGAAEVYGKEIDYPDVIHFYPSQNPKPTDKYRLFIMEKYAFQYKEIH